ncbi:MAG TPA: hypothetical protein VGN72_09505 [Tepidisphaeraceae bacterium]|nr:hypothetical protein [Tepidisphaeraceae bacterium]
MFTLCSARSLLLCVAVCALWVRSYWVDESVTIRWDKRVTLEQSLRYAHVNYGAYSGRGYLMFNRTYNHRPTADARPQPFRVRWKRRRDEPIRTIGLYGFATEVQDWGPFCWAVHASSTSGQWAAARAGDPHYRVDRAFDVPYWLIASPATLLPPAWLWSAFRRSRDRRAMATAPPAATTSAPPPPAAPSAARGGARR